MKYIDLIGNAAGIVGVLVCLIAGLARLVGTYYLLGVPSITLFTGGTALMVMACLAKLHYLSQNTKTV